MTDKMTKDEVIERVTMRRFELPIGADAVASAHYAIDDGCVVLIHTDVPMAYSGQGYASRLATGTFNLLRTTRRKAILKCPFMGAFFASHPEYADVVAG